MPSPGRQSREKPYFFALILVDYEQIFGSSVLKVKSHYPPPSRIGGGQGKAAPSIFHLKSLLNFNKAA
jgi:hypothetical protein